MRLLGEARGLLPVLRDQLVEGAVEERGAELDVALASHRDPELLVHRPRPLDLARPLQLERIRSAWPAVDRKRGKVVLERDPARRSLVVDAIPAPEPGHTCAGQGRGEQHRVIDVPSVSKADARVLPRLRPVFVRVAVSEDLMDLGE